MTPTPPPPEVLPDLVELSAHIDAMTAAFDPQRHAVDSPVGRAHRRALALARGHVHDPREAAVSITVPVEVADVCAAAVAELGNPSWARLEPGPGTKEVTLTLRARFTVPLEMLRTAELLLQVREALSDVSSQVAALRERAEPGGTE